MDEQKWIERIVAGDRMSFSCLVAKYEKMAYTIAFRMMENREEAEEVVQDAFLKVYRALPAFQFECKFSTWFYRIVYRTALTALRGRHNFISYDDVAPAELEREEIEAASLLIERKERKAVVSAVLHQLPPDESLLLTLYYLEECSVEEIRQITGLTPSNVKVKLFRGRKHFYETLHRTMNIEKTDVL